MDPTMYGRAVTTGTTTNQAAVLVRLRAALTAVQPPPGYRINVGGHWPDNDPTPPAAVPALV